MTLHDKIQKITDSDLALWIKTRQTVSDELSDRQTMFCFCGKLASGLHESYCSKFRNEVDKETVKRLSK